MLKQTELIKSALNELGCEEAPSACDLSIDNQTFINNSSEQVNIYENGIIWAKQMVVNGSNYVNNSL